MLRTYLLNSAGTAALLLGSASPLWAQNGNAPPAQTAPSAEPDNPATSRSASGSTSDIIVTARKRDERLLDVPISVQAFSRAEIRASGIDDIQTLKDRAGFQAPPVLSTQPAGRFSGNLIFRGLQASAFGQARDSSGSLFVDGIFVSGGPQSINTVDVERIEVLKGPQNAFFGRSTFGGAVNFITRNPRQPFSGEINARATARGSVDADASIEGGVLPGLLAARLTAYTHDKVAQYRATDGGALGAEKTRGLGLTLYLTPSENLWLRLRGNIQRDEDSSGNIALLAANALAPGACAGRTIPGFNQRTGAAIPFPNNRNYFCNGLPSLDTIGTNVITTTTRIPQPLIDAVRTNQVFIAGPSVATPNPALVAAPFFSRVPNLDHAGLRRDAIRLSGQTQYSFDSGASLAFNAGFNKQDAVSIYDIDRTDRAELAAPFTAYLDAQALRSEDLTLDARFVSDPAKRLRVLLGASYFHGKYQIGQASYNYPQNVPAAIRAQFPNGTVTRSVNYQNDRANVPAIYGSIDFDIIDSITLSAEGRYQEDKTSTTTLAGVKFERTYKDFLPRVTAKFSPTRDLNIYASYSKGVQPAGFNAGFAALTPVQQQYVQTIFPGLTEFSLVPELDAYEIGVKQKALGGRLVYSVAAYQNDWKNAVTTASVFNPASCFATTPITQLTPACPLASSGTFAQTPNTARIRGVEFAATAFVSPSLSVDLTVDYKNAKWRRLASGAFNSLVFAAGSTAFPLGAQPGDVYRGDGNFLARVPKWSGTLSSTYRGRLTQNAEFYVRGDALYTGRTWDSDLNLFQTDDYVRVNARAGVEVNNLTLELFATNLFNDKTYDFASITVELQGSFADRAVLVQPAQRREFGLRAQYKF